MRLKRLIGALLVALSLALVMAPTRASAETYSGWFYPGWNIFTWCNWTYTDFGNGNYIYWDTCGGYDSYLDMRY